MSFVIPICVTCRRPLEPRAEPRGRPRLYCSDACRRRAWRDRQSTVAILEAYDAPAPTPAVNPAPSLPPAASTDDQVARAVLELTHIGGAFARLSREARPELAWRAELLAAKIREGLDDLFGGIG